MGILTAKGKLTSYIYLDQNNEPHVGKHGHYKNDDAVDNLIRYVTRTRPNEDRRSELIYAGAFGAADHGPIDNVIFQFLYVQEIMRNQTNRKMYHFVYDLDSYEEAVFGNNLLLGIQAIRSQAYSFFVQGHQVVFAIHRKPEEGMHFHFAVNSVNYLTGRMYHSSKKRFSCSLGIHADAFLSDYSRIT